MEHQDKTYTREQLIYWLLSRNAIIALRYVLHGTSRYEKGMPTAKTLRPIYRKMSDESILRESIERVEQYHQCWPHRINFTNLSLLVNWAQPWLPMLSKHREG